MIDLYNNVKLADSDLPYNITLFKVQHHPIQSR